MEGERCYFFINVANSIHENKQKGHTRENYIIKYLFYLSLLICTFQVSITVVILFDQRNLIKDKELFNEMNVLK